MTGRSSSLAHRKIVLFALVLGASCGGNPKDSTTPDLLTACDPPQQLTATVFNRRQTSVHLAWTAPGVVSYAVRSAKVPITFMNFDDTTVTTAASYAGTPAGAGLADAATVSGLSIEVGYYFAVAGKDAAGRYTWFQSTDTPLAAHFNVTALGGTGATNEGFGYALAGEGDADGDGKSDLLAGAYNSGRVSIYLGASGFGPLTPSVVITGTAATFGRGLSYIGDIDGDGREDIALGDPTRRMVFIYKGRASWPATLAEANADYTITTDAAYAASSFGTTMSRLGDFNGDGVDDFAIGAPNFGTGLIGRVVIVLGASGFSSLALPSTSRAIVIDGDATLTRPFFGTRVVGMGHLYAGTGTTLAVSAPGLVGAPSNNEGRIYTFRGQSGSSGVISISAADHSTVGPSPNLRVGSSLANLGHLFGPLPAVGTGNPNDVTVPAGSGSVYAFSGDLTSGPFVNRKTFDMSAGYNTGTSLIGGGMPGRDVSLSLLGDATPDIIIIPKTSTYLPIIDGATMSSLGAMTDASSVPVLVPLPTNFGPLSPTAVLLSDVDGDGYPDFAVSSALSTIAGKVAVYW